MLLAGLYDRCGAVFEHLATASCSTDVEDVRRAASSQSQQPAATAEKKTSPASVISSVLGGRPKLARLHAAHALSMDVLLSMALEMGTHTHACWKHVFRLTFTALRLEGARESAYLRQVNFCRCPLFAKFLRVMSGLSLKTVCQI